MATLAGRSTCALMRATCSKARTFCQSGTISKRISVSTPSILPNLTLRVSRTPLPSPRMVVRRELSSLLPFHSAIASACLVSKLPSEASATCEGRFANYVSPI